MANVQTIEFDGEYINIYGELCSITGDEDYEREAGK